MGQAALAFSPTYSHVFFFFFFNVTLIIYCQFEQIFKSYSNLFKRAKCLHANFFQEKKNPSSLELKIKFLKCFWGYPFLLCFFFLWVPLFYCQFEHIFTSYSNLFKRAKCLHANFFQEKKNPSSLELKIKFLKCFWGYPFLLCFFFSE